MSLESDFRDWFRGRWIGWIDGREPAGGRGQRRSGWGSGRGAPDLTLGVPLDVKVPSTLWKQGPDIRQVLLLPCELKRAKFVHGDKLVSESEVNVDQRAWHAKAKTAGVMTAFLWGVEGGSSGWRAFIMKPNTGFALPGEYLELGMNENVIRHRIQLWVATQYLDIPGHAWPTLEELKAGAADDLPVLEA